MYAYRAILTSDFSLLPNDSLKRANIRFAIEFFGSYAFPEMLKYCYNKEDNAVETFRANLNAAFKRVSLPFN